MLPTSFVERHPTLAAWLDLLIVIILLYSMFYLSFVWSFRRNSIFVRARDFDASGVFKGRSSDLSQKRNIVVEAGLGGVKFIGDVQISGDLLVGKDTEVTIEGHLSSYRGNVGKGSLIVTQGTEVTW